MASKMCKKHSATLKRLKLKLLSFSLKNSIISLKYSD